MVLVDLLPDEREDADHGRLHAEGDLLPLLLLPVGLPLHVLAAHRGGPLQVGVHEDAGLHEPHVEVGRHRVGHPPDVALHDARGDGRGVHDDRPVPGVRDAAEARRVRHVRLCVLQGGERNVMDDSQRIRNVLSLPLENSWGLAPIPHASEDDDSCPCEHRAQTLAPLEHDGRAPLPPDGSGNEYGLHPHVLPSTENERNVVHVRDAPLGKNAGHENDRVLGNGIAPWDRDDDEPIAVSSLPPFRRDVWHSRGADEPSSSPFQTLRGSELRLYWYQSDRSVTSLRIRAFQELSFEVDRQRLFAQTLDPSCPETSPPLPWTPLKAEVFHGLAFSHPRARFRCCN